MAYGTATHKLQFDDTNQGPALTPIPAVNGAVSTQGEGGLVVPAAVVELEKGQNIFELSIVRGEALRKLLLLLSLLWAASFNFLSLMQICTFKLQFLPFCIVLPVILAPPALAVCGSDPRTFVTYDFFQHDTQSTSVITGPSPAFNQTSQVFS